jgi:DNA-binding beta-propeller fold protein YncE
MKRTRKSLWLVAVALFFFAFAAFGSSVARERFTPGARSQQPWPPALLRPLALSASDPLLYVSGYVNSVVDIYDLGESGSPLVGTITDGIDGPGGMALDANDTLYVANNVANTVTVYPFGQTQPSLTLSKGLNYPIDIAVARNGDVYVTNRNPPGIAVYKAGHTRLQRFITNALIEKPEQIFFARKGELYISDDNTGVSVMQKDGTITSLGLHGLGSITSGLALDERDGYLFVGDNSSPQIHVFLPGQTSPAYNLSIAGPNFITIGDVGGKRYVMSPDSSSPDVFFFRHKHKRLIQAFQTSADYANGIAFKPASASNAKR